MSLLFKVATEAKEFEQIIQLNYRTFVEEIPQHEQNHERKLIDKFHDENTYIICVKNDCVIGMICVRANRPFSLDGKIGPIENHLQITTQLPVEIRLLAVDQTYRNNARIFFGLAQALIRYCLKCGYDLAVISGTTRQTQLYEQLGFKKFAYLTGTGDALFQPMYLTKETFEAGVAGRLLKEPLNYLPGPATINSKVTDAFIKLPISHRSKSYQELFERTKEKLIKLVNANHVQILQGTGTLANDAVAAQLSCLDGKGIILHNGEFGERLKKHAQTFQLDYDGFQAENGQAFCYEKLAQTLAGEQYSWLWFVHSETSTGILNDLEKIKQLCQQHRMKIAVDCISSIGTLPIDLDGVTLATAVSGKALASYTGLSFVFHHDSLTSNQLIPRYLDLALYEEKDGTPFTQSSNLIAALDVALNRFENATAVYKEIEERYMTIRSKVESWGLNVLASSAHATPCIMTIQFPEGVEAFKIGENLYLNGFELHYESEYLRANNWLQISCMNEIPTRATEKFLNMFEKLIEKEVATNTQ